MNDPSDFEFERDCELFDAALEAIETLGDEAPVGRKVIMGAFAVALGFLNKYRDRMEASSMDVDELLREIAAQAKIFDGMLAKEEKANDAYLEAVARRSEAAAKIIEAEYRILHAYDHRQDADWDALPPMQKEELAEQMKALRARMPELLSSLPIEKRRELERLK